MHLDLIARRRSTPGPEEAPAQAALNLEDVARSPPQELATDVRRERRTVQRVDPDIRSRTGRAHRTPIDHEPTGDDHIPRRQNSRFGLVGEPPAQPHLVDRGLHHLRRGCVFRNHLSAPLTWSHEHLLEARYRPGLVA